MFLGMLLTLISLTVGSLVLGIGLAWSSIFPIYAAVNVFLIFSNHVCQRRWTSIGNLVTDQLRLRCIWPTCWGYIYGPVGRFTVLWAGWSWWPLCRFFTLSLWWKTFLWIFPQWLYYLPSSPWISTHGYRVLRLRFIYNRYTGIIISAPAGKLSGKSERGVNSPKRSMNF